MFAIYLFYFYKKQRLDVSSENLSMGATIGLSQLI